MTFRSKLLASILTVVAATTAATLCIAQSQNTASYQAVLDELFRAEADSIRARQQQQMLVTSAQASKLAESVRLFAALEEGIPETYEIAGAELRVADRAFFRLVDAKGKLITPPEGNTFAGLVGSGIDAPLAKLLSARRATGQSDTAAQLGFVNLAPAGDAPFTASVALSPITNFDSTVGLLVIGHRVDLHPPAQAGDGVGLLTGLIVDGALHSETIPKMPPADLENALRSGQRSDGITVEGARYRIDSSALNPGSAFPIASLISLYPLADLHRRQRELIWRITSIGGAGLLAAVAVGSLFARRLSQPVRDLVAGTTEIKQGNFDARVPKRTSDELGTLADAFNEMAAGLALKEKYRSVLQLVTDRSVADELMSGAVQLGGETREVSVIFCDIRGFTGISQGMAPADVVAMLNEHMSVLTHVVHEHHGVVDKFVGDSIMTLFGAPKSYGHDAVSAVRCAWRMIRERERMNATSVQPLRIGIGIATGPALAGCMGSEKRLNYTVIGERVNLAARLCSKAGPMEIVIDEATRAELPPGFETQTLEALELKGFAEPVVAYQLKSVPS